MERVTPGTIRVFADPGCPWAHASVYRLHEARRLLGLEDEVSFDIRAFPLELINSEPTPRAILDAEVPVVGAIAPEAGWSMWDAPAESYPVTMLPAMEAVYAAKQQSLGLSDRLDRALRVAFFRDSRCISLHTQILEVASTVAGLDLKMLEENMIEGRFKRRIFEDHEAARGDEVQGSPHIFLADGSNAHNPGIEMHWVGPKPAGFPVVDEDRPEVYEEVLTSAVRTEARGR